MSNYQPAAKRTLFNSPPSSSSSTPRSSRDKENVSGHLLMVGEEQQGQNNRYFEILINTAPNALGRITVMTLGLTINFKVMCMKAINLYLKAPADRESGKWFFNQRFGDKCGEMANLPFRKMVLPITPISQLTQETPAGVYVRGKIVWLDEAEVTTTGKLVRNGIIKDQSGEMRLPIWNQNLIGSLKGGKFHRQCF